MLPYGKQHMPLVLDSLDSDSCHGSPNAASPSARLSGSLTCLICSAQATGYHFDAQSCSACAAFFRRTVSLQRVFRCITGKNDCLVHYSMHQICRSCRLAKCTKNGMNRRGVQPKRQQVSSGRAFFTQSGLRRNKRFAVIQPADILQSHKELSTASEPTDCASNSSTSTRQSTASPVAVESKTSEIYEIPISPRPSVLQTEDVLSLLVREEMRLGERRRIMFCERPVERLLGQNRHCPYTREDIRPLSFRAFRKSIRTHILLIYEWLQAWPDYQKLDNTDKVSFLRKCVLFHTILDPVFISIQIGYPDRFVMQNGGYVSCLDDCEDGWEDEKEISGKIKKHIYQPLLKKIMAEIIPPILQLDLSFEEFVALKGFVSWQGAIENVSSAARDVMRKQVDAIASSLHSHYIKNGQPAAERLGSIILLLSSIFSTGLDFVESHRQIEFFDLWQLDSLLLQLLNLDAIMDISA
ncbi:unnamed protein product [Auanema sp. JU1783]|nr:unnamed protein product [Auanema sp. JU1783]